MLNDNEIKEAVETLKNKEFALLNCEEEKMKCDISLSILLNLANLCLATAGVFPKKKVCPLCNDSGRTKGIFGDNTICEATHGFHNLIKNENDIIDLCRLALVKKLGGLEEVIKNNLSCEYVHRKELSRLATAIRKEIIGEDR